MPKKRKSPNGKRAKSSRKTVAAAPKSDPEFDALQEQFSEMSVDFNSLAELADKN